MKKIYAIALLCIPLFLILSFITTATIGVSEGQRRQTQVGSYHRETDSISMLEVGKLLERLGQEIQRDNSVNFDGKSFPIKGQGGLELSVMPRGARTSLHIEINAGATEIDTSRKTYVAFARVNRSGTPVELAEFLTKLGKNLESTGSFEIENHKVILEGTASVKQRLTERTRQGRPPYTFNLDFIIGERDFPLPQDEEDAVAEEKRGDIQEIAIEEIESADQKAIIKLFDSLSKDLTDGRLRVSDKDLSIGENLSYNITHLIATKGKSQRIRVSFTFGEIPPRSRPTGPRYSEEFFDVPMTEVAELLKRIGIEILEDGTFKLDDNDFKVKEKANYELSVSSNNITFELSYTRPKRK